MAVVLHTTHGDLPILLHFKECPKAAFNFLALCASNYYDNCAFLRYFPDTLLQTGDPTNTGKGGEAIFAKLPITSSSTEEQEEEQEEESNDNTFSDSKTDNLDNVNKMNFAAIERSCYFDDEGFGITTHAHRGVLSMAHKGSKPNTNASQFLILCSPQPSLDGIYTAFGQVDLTGKYIPTSHIVWHDKGNVCKTNASNNILSSSPDLSFLPSSFTKDVNEEHEYANIKTGDEVLQALQNTASLIGTDSKHRIKQKERTLEFNAEYDNNFSSISSSKGNLATTNTAIPK